MFDDVEGVVEDRLDLVVVLLGSFQAAEDLGHLVCQTCLFAFEQVEGDGAVVVGFEEFAALAVEAVVFGLEFASFGACVLEAAAEFFTEEAFESFAEIVVEGDGAVVLGDLVLDFVDQHDLPGAGGGLGVAASAHEVLVLLAVTCRGDLDEHSAAAATAVEARLEVVRVLPSPLALAVEFEDGRDC
nr:hypothetical protein [Rathayibacter sp. VKM Ac-2878]